MTTCHMAMYVFSLHVPSPNFEHQRLEQHSRRLRHDYMANLRDPFQVISSLRHIYDQTPISGLPPHVDVTSFRTVSLPCSILRWLTVQASPVFDTVSHAGVQLLRRSATTARLCQIEDDSSRDEVLSMQTVTTFWLRRRVSASRG